MADLGDCNDTEKDNAGSWEGFISMEPGCVNLELSIYIIQLKLIYTFLFLIIHYATFFM